MDSYTKMLHNAKDGIELYAFKKLSQPFPPHFHKAWLIGCLNSGQRLLRLGGREIIISPDELVVLPPFANHSCKPVENGISNWLCLQLAPGAVSRPIPAGIYKNNKKLGDYFRWLCGYIFAWGHLPQDDWQKLQELLKIDLRAEISIDTEINTSAYDDICDFLNEDTPESVSLAELSAAANSGKFTFLRGFQKKRGITPYKYFSSLRLHKAQQLLQAGLDPAQCAASCGFCDQSHFSRIFKTSIGVTPGVYRKSCREAGK